MLKYMAAVIALCLPTFNCFSSEPLEASFGNNVNLSVSVEPFGDENVKRCGEYICAIDGTVVYGSDGNVPKSKLVKVVLGVNGVNYNLDASGMYDPGITKGNMSSRITVTPFWGGFYKITGYFSDGAGSYVAQWTAGNSASIRNFIGSTEELSEITYWLDSKFHNNSN